MTNQDRRTFIAAALAAPLAPLPFIEGPAIARPDPVGTPFEIFAQAYSQMGRLPMNVTETELRTHCLRWASDMMDVVEDIDERRGEMTNNPTEPDEQHRGPKITGEAAPF